LIFREVEDRDLIAKARRGQVDAYNVLVSRWERRIFNYLYRLVGEASLAEDLVQETFTRAWRARAQMVVVDNPRAWLYRIATNAARDNLRRRRLIAWLPILSTDQHLSDSSLEDSSLEAEHVRRALLRLKPDYRIPLVLYTCQDFSVAEIAAALALSTEAVKQRLVRARRQLRDALE